MKTNITKLCGLLLCVASLTSCTDPSPTTLGAAVQGMPLSVAAIQQAGVDSSAILHGTMTKKCPVAGCWFVLTDSTGTIKVDTKNAGFVVVDVPLNATLTVAGRVMTNETGRFIDATGVRY